jgi:serine/threonine protein phosphatase PrpC
MFYGSHSEQGFRDTMEDFCAVKSTDNSLLCGVFDGHGGTYVAEKCKNELLDMVEERMKTEPTGAAMKNAMLELEEMLDKEASSLTGSAALVVVVDETDIHIANLGDCRAVLVTDKVVRLTRDHTPENELEKQRMIDAKVPIFRDKNDVLRVGGILSMTRAMGDEQLKPAVTSEPELFEFPRPPFGGVLIIASDGLWILLDELSEDELNKLLTSIIERVNDRVKSRFGVKKQSILVTCVVKLLMQSHIVCGRHENITIMAVAV